MVDAPFIGTVPRGPIQPAYLAIVEEVRAVLGQRLGRRLHSLYLYGSVATSKAVWGRSDLDLTLVLANAPSPEEAREIEATRIGLEQAHPGIPKIDFDVGCLADVLDPLNLHSWGFWLKHKCRCIGGEDLASRFAPFRPSRAIALAVNGHFGEVLDGYASRIDAQADSANLPRLMKESARKASRATNVLRSNDEAAWPETLEEHAQAFRKICPEQADAVDYFMAQQHAPSASAAEFSGRLRAFSMWLQARCSELLKTEAPAQSAAPNRRPT